MSLGFYYTSSDFEAYDGQSLGGYVSNSLYEKYNITSNVDLLNQSFVPNSNFSYYGFNGEIVKKNNNVFLRGQLGTRPKSSRPKIGDGNDYVLGLSKNILFNNSYNNENKQYRCIVCHNYTNNIYRNLRFYIKNNTEVSFFRIALEMPKNEILSGIADSGSSLFLTDNSLIGLFDSEYDSCILEFLSGLNVGLKRKIASFDKTTGSFTFINSLPYNVSVGDSYIIKSIPSTVIKSSFNAPSGDFISDFSLAEDISSSIFIDFKESRVNGNDLHPNESIYIWIEKNFIKNKEEKIDNNFTIAAAYNVL